MARDQTLTTKLVVDDEASQPTEDYAKILDKLDGETATVELAIKAAGVQGQLEDLLVEISELDSSDPTIDVKLEQAAQAKADLDQLQSKIKEINSTDVEVETKTATKGVKDLGTESDNTRSVMANMTGNTAAELGEVAGISGTAGQALGQLGEYAAEGNIHLSELAKVAGPMAALSIVTFGLAQNQKKQAAAARDAARAMEELSTVSDDMLGQTLGTLITKTILAGESLDDMFTKLADSNIEGARRTLEWAEATGQAKGLIDELREAIKKKEDADAQGKKTADEYGDSTLDTAAAAKSAASEIAAMNDETKTQTRLVADATRGLDLMQGALDFEQATLNFQSAFQRAQESVASGTQLSKQDILDLKQEYLRVAREIGLSPVQVKSDLEKLDQGDIDSVLWTTQQALNKAPVDIQVRLNAANAARDAARAAQTAQAAANAGTQTINVNLPRGARSSDVVRAMSAHTRRAGRRYGAPVVTRAR